MDPSWTQSSENAFRQAPDDGSGTRVGLVRALGVVSEQHSGVMPAPLGNHMYRHASVKESRFMATPQIVEAQALKAERASPFDNPPPITRMQARPRLGGR
jgi:hypothetical protein